jgi:crotonobetainyl-CoA:carnitine CoA-transferase CaiB-like acyl-CoA transferase
MMPNKFKPYEEAKKFVHSLNLKSQREWIQFCKSDKKPSDIPSLPEVYYRTKGWINYSHWLLDKSNIISTRYRPFPEARDFVRSLGLISQKQWIEYCNSENKPNDIPTNPHGAYKKSGWLGYLDWLGVKKNIHNYGQYTTYDMAKGFVHCLKLKSIKEWYAYCKSGNKPQRIPNSPISVYKNSGWVSWGEWLGNGKVHPKYKEFRNFEEARCEIRALNLNSYRGWIAYCKSGLKSPDIPNDPRSVYKNQGWAGYLDWIGKEKTQKVSKTRNPINVAELNIEDNELLLRILSTKSKKEYGLYRKLKSDKKK